MNKTIHITFVLVSACCIALFAQGCKETHSPGDGHDHGTVSPSSTADAHAALHQTKYNKVLVEFPGHKYAMEIIDEKETTGLVTAFLTDAHFEPVEVDAKEVHLNFIIDGAPKTFTLMRKEQEAGKPAAFMLTDMQLATLNDEGWHGEATAAIEIGGAPYNAPLKKLGGHDHGEGDNHAH